MMPKGTLIFTPKSKPDLLLTRKVDRSTPPKLMIQPKARVPFNKSQTTA